MPGEMSMSAVAFALSVLIVVVPLSPISRFKYNPPWVRVFGILPGASGTLGSAASVFGIVGYRGRNHDLGTA